jgi:hypothetical protein
MHHATMHHGCCASVPPQGRPMYMGRYGGRGGPQARRGVCALHGVRVGHLVEVPIFARTERQPRRLHPGLETGRWSCWSGWQGCSSCRSSDRSECRSLRQHPGSTCWWAGPTPRPTLPPTQPLDASFCLVGEEKKAQREKANSKKQPCSAEGPLTHNTRPSPRPCTWCLPWTLSDGKGLSHGDGVCMDDCSERVNN